VLSYLSECGKGQYLSTKKKELIEVLLVVYMNQLELCLCKLFVFVLVSN